MNKTDYYDNYPEDVLDGYEDSPINIINNETSLLVMKNNNFYKSCPIIISFFCIIYFGIAMWIGLCFIPSIHHNNNTHIFCPKFTLI